jgi:hypothetical protein
MRTGLARATVVVAFAVVAAPLGATACGGHLAPLQADGGMESPDSGGPGGPDAVVIDVILIRPDGGPGPGCEPDNVPCIDPQQCCSGVCVNSTCGGPNPPPPCKPDGFACGQPGECCNFDCTMGICSSPMSDAGPPPMCSPGANQCTSCVFGACCPQELACEQDATCVQFINCFDACYAGPGTGNMCATACGQQHGDPTVQSLIQCATGTCVTQCQ